MFNNCKLIAIEGCDKLGKSTSALRLASTLDKTKYEKIPCQDGATYGRIYEMLHTGEALEEPYFFQALNGVNRILWQTQRLPALAQQYDYIILDRWDLSSWVYGLASGAMNERQLEIATRGLIEPDVYFIFQGKPFHRGGVEDSYESNNELQNKVAKLYTEFGKKKNNCHFINANQSMEDVTKSLLVQIKKHDQSIK